MKQLKEQTTKELTNIRFPDFIHFSQSHLLSLERMQRRRDKCSDVCRGLAQCAHISFAHERLWRSQDRAEETSTVNICSCEGLTALK